MLAQANGVSTTRPIRRVIIATAPRITYPLTVLSGEIFVLGDNRQSSSDSRTFGPVPDANIIGKVILRFWPFDRLNFFEW